MTTPSERAFVTFQRGQIRDAMLAHFRNGLRSLVNPDTGDFFSEEDIRLATQEGSRDYLRLDAADLGLQAVQQRARFTAQQADPARASSEWLRGFHCPLWGIEPLPASSGSGPGIWSASPNSVFVGSTTLGDPTAFVVTDPRGNLFQCFRTVVVPGSGIAALTFVAVAGGKGSNPSSGTILKASANTPLGAAPSGTTTASFSGGFDAESDQELVERLLDRIKRRPGSGNRAQFRVWARGVTTAVESAWVYPCLFNTGSVALAITQKRGTIAGPLARIPNDEVLAAVRAFLTPPGSKVVPGRVHVLVHKVVSDPISMSMRLRMRGGTSGGWFDVQPWPRPLGSTTNEESFCRITTLSSQTDVRFFAAAAPATGVTPSVMAWDPETSRFLRLPVLSVTSLGGNEYRLQLSGTPPVTLALGDIICPYTALHTAIATAAETYFDALGPGEMIDLATSPRAGRAYRWPQPHDEAPYEAGQSIVSELQDALGSALAGVSMAFATHTVPALPTDLASEGPRLLTLDGFGAYPS